MKILIEDRDTIFRTFRLRSDNDKGCLNQCYTPPLDPETRRIVKDLHILGILAVFLFL